MPGRVLVTGAGGFVGINLVRGLAERGWHVFALARRQPDDVARRFLASVASRVDWRLGDVTDRSGMASLAEDADAIVHAAAVTATPDREAELAARVFDVNAGGTLSLLEAARTGACHRFVLVSSGGLYGPAAPTPALDESTPLRSENMYGVAKAAAERLTLRYADLHDLSVAIGRLGTTYGPLERASGSRSGLSAVQQAVLAFDAADDDRPVRVAGAEIARDFLHVDDAVDAFARLLDPPDGELPHRVYNVGAPVAAPLRVALDALAARTGRAWQPVDAAGDVPDLVQTPANARAAMDMTRIEADTGWAFRYDLAAGTLATWDRRDEVAPGAP
jgi:UDP-glucuronate 4-epimerase